MALFKDLTIGSVQLQVYGRDHDWRLPKVSRNNVTLRELRRIKDISEPLQTRVLLLPTLSTFSGQFASAKDFKNSHPIGINREKTLLYGHEADCVALERGQSVAMRTGDCPTIIAQSKDKRVVAHAGRDLLWDKEYVLGRKDPSRHESIISLLCQQFQLADTVHFYITTGISPKNFFHQTGQNEQGKQNYCMIQHLIKRWCREVVLGCTSYGAINLDVLIREQISTYSRIAGIKRVEIESDLASVCTFEDERLWSHRQAVTAGTHNGRNMIVVSVV